MNAQQLALAYRFLLGLTIVEIPIVSYELQQPVFDWKHLAIGLLGGLAAVLEKWVAPYVFGGLNAAPSDVAHAPNPVAATAAAQQAAVIIQAAPEQIVPPPPAA